MRRTQLRRPAFATLQISYEDFAVTPASRCDATGCVSEHLLMDRLRGQQRLCLFKPHTASARIIRIHVVAFHLAN